MYREERPNLKGNNTNIREKLHKSDDNSADITRTISISVPNTLFSPRCLIIFTCDSKSLFFYHLQLSNTWSVAPENVTQYRESGDVTRSS